MQNQEFTYFLWAPITNMVKIGWSGKPDKRKDELSRMGPELLILLAVVPGGQKVENGLHLRFHRINDHDEWFRLTSELLALILHLRKKWLDTDPAWYYDALSAAEEVVAKNKEHLIPRKEIMSQLFPSSHSFHAWPDYIPNKLKKLLPNPQEIVVTQEDWRNYLFMSRECPLKYDEHKLTMGIALLCIMHSLLNRKLNVNWCLQKIDDVQKGRFYIGHDLVCFTSDGIMVNGHHRCILCILAGLPFMIAVRRQVPLIEVKVIDTEGNRRDMDASRVMSQGDDEMINNDNASIVKLIMTRGKQEKTSYTMQQLEDLINHFRPQLVWLNNITSQYDSTAKQKVAITPVRTVFVRAACSGANREKLEYAWHYLLGRGSKVEKQEVPLIPGTDSLRSLINVLTNYESNGGVERVKKVYKQTERMLSAFLNGQELLKVHEADSEQFPLLRPPSVVATSVRTSECHPAMEALEKWAADQTQETVFSLGCLIKKLLKDEDDHVIESERKYINKRINQQGCLVIGIYGAIYPIIRPGGKRASKFRYQRFAQQNPAA